MVIEQLEYCNNRKINNCENNIAAIFSSQINKSQSPKIKDGMNPNAFGTTETMCRNSIAEYQSLAISFVFKMLLTYSFNTTLRALIYVFTW